jgi:hypothetical protein
MPTLKRAPEYMRVQTIVDGGIGGGVKELTMTKALKKPRKIMAQDSEMKIFSGFNKNENKNKNKVARVQVQV